MVITDLGSVCHILSERHEVLRILVRLGLMQGRG